jgi:hypothetical protein
MRCSNGDVMPLTAHGLSSNLRGVMLAPQEPSAPPGARRDDPRAGSGSHRFTAAMRRLISRVVPLDAGQHGLLAERTMPITPPRPHEHDEAESRRR